MAEFNQMAERALANDGFLVLDAPKIGESLLEIEGRGFRLASEHGLDFIQQHIFDDEVSPSRDEVEAHLTITSASDPSSSPSFLSACSPIS